jgi:hypothetical protein
LSFYAGYKALDHLDDAVAGETASIQRIIDYLSQVPAYLKKGPDAPPPPLPKRKDPPYHTPPEKQFLNVFPREAVKGERRVPHFVRANGFPMVRWKKPQANNLTRTLRGLIKGKQKSLDAQQDYEEYYMPLARNEETWDSLTRNEMHQRRDEEENSWAKDTFAGLRFIKGISQERHRKTMEKAHKMVAIVEREQELADMERTAKSEQKN